ncbi:MAG: radical SAM protein [candidate division KSB1 bacterium]|nr:radical SAM protein [candidate division KSB1 bacterium]
MVENLVYNQCQLCPRNCQANRSNSKLGYCGESDRLRIATIEAHFGEEPPISGTNGSGTVFFSGCSLKCIYCQNYQISHQHLGRIMTVSEVVDRLNQLIVEYQVHNINFVTPDHFFPHTVEIGASIRRLGYSIPIVYNLSGYQSIQSLKLIGSAADIYLPDFKYSDATLAKALSNCEDYPEIALTAIHEMVRQKGFLDSFRDDSPKTNPIASRGVLVRHLIIPGQVKNSIDALTILFLEFGKHLPVSLMSQYVPIKKFPFEFLNQTVSQLEFSQVYEHALELGFENLFVQFPEPTTKSRPFLPDFSQPTPFLGNVIQRHRLSSVYEPHFNQKERSPSFRYVDEDGSL